MQQEHSNPPVPQAIDTERVVLARALTSKEEALDLLSKADASCFWNYAHQLIFTAIRDIIAHNGTPDVVTVSERLKDSNVVKFSDVSELIVAAFDSHAPIGQLTSILQQVATQRSVLKLIEEARRNIAEAKPDVLPHLINKLLDINNGASNKTLFTAEEISKEYFATLADREQQGGIAGIPFGYHTLDLATAGAKPGQLIIVAGRPSQGKSAFSENIITNMLRRGVKVYFASAETGREEIMDRMVGRITGLGHNALMGGVRDEENLEKINNALAQISEFPLYLQDNSNITSDQILAEATRLKLQNKLDVVVVDYLQFLRDKTERGETRERTVARISQNLKSVARTLNVPVIVTAQLSRDAAGKNSRPELHHLRESGQVEQDADVAILLWRGDEPNITHFDIAKNRSGRTGVFDLSFNGATVKFDNYVTPPAVPNPGYRYAQG